MARSLISLVETDLTHPGIAVTDPSDADSVWTNWGTTGAFPYEPATGFGPWSDAFDGNPLFPRPAYRIDSFGMLRLTGASAKIANSTGGIFGSLITTFPVGIRPFGNFVYSFMVPMLVNNTVWQGGIVQIFGGDAGVFSGQVYFQGPFSLTTQLLDWNGVAYLARG